MTHQFYGGTSGLLLAMPKRDFPPEHYDKSRLAFYALHQNSIEINSSFYKLPRAKTISRWVAEVPDQFLFTFKLWKGITHQKELLFNNNDVTRFMEAIASANEKRGCLLIQFPPGLQANAKPQLQELLKSVKAYDWRAAVEFRHSSWYRDSIFELLNAYQAAMVIQDMPKSATPLELTADALVYLRFHGPSGNYKDSYSEAFLSEYANYIAEWQQQGRAVFCYFNNTAGAALQNLNFLKHCLAQISPC